MAKFVAHASYTDAELLELARAQIAAITATGQATSDEGHTLTRADLASLLDTVERLEQRIARSSAPGPVTNLARLRRAR